MRAERRAGPFWLRHRILIAAFWVALAAIAAPLAAQVTHNLSSQGFEVPQARSVWADNQLQKLTPTPTASPQLLGALSPAATKSLAAKDKVPGAWLHPVPGGGLLLLPPAATRPAAVASFLTDFKHQGGTLTEVTDAQVGKVVSRDSEQTLKTASALALPILAVLLLLVFGTVASAVLPLVIAIAGSVVALGTIDLLENHMVLSVYLTDIVTFLALGVGVDYALFISSRFRSALDGGKKVGAAVSEAMASSGRSVFYSGLAVALALATLLLGSTAYWRGLALGGAVAVVSVLLATHTLLPALLAMMGEKIRWGTLPRVRRFAGFWPALSRFVTRRPVAAAALGTFLLLVPGVFGPGLAMSIPANLASILPQNAPLRQATAVEQKVNGPGSIAPFVVALTFPKGLSDPATWQQVSSLTSSLKATAGVASVASPTALGLPPQALAAIANGSVPPAKASAALSRFMSPKRAPGLVVLYVTSKTGPDSAQSAALLGRLRTQVAHLAPQGGRWGVGGTVSLLSDFDHLVTARLPWIIAAVGAVAFVVLFLATGALWQALLGVAMDALVALATAGLLVLTVQHGAFGLFPQPLNTAVTPLIFVLLFGLSMDYEVILLHRMQEGLRRGLRPADAARVGVEATGGMITGAGMIMVIVFVVLVLSPLEILKTLGIGMTAAILLDTWLVRTFVVPACVTLLGGYAFWPFGGRRGRHVRR